VSSAELLLVEPCVTPLELFAVGLQYCDRVACSSSVCYSIFLVHLKHVSSCKGFVRMHTVYKDMSDS
jgi:hypothetical protein